MPATLRIYTRAKCPLCREEEGRARQLVEALGDGAPVIEVVDIESDDRLMTAMLERIPVIELDGAVVGELDRAAEGLERALADAGHRAYGVE